MNIQIFGTKKCNDTKKAQRFFKERGIKFQFIDILDKGMSKGEFQSVAKAHGGIDAIILNPAQSTTVLLETMAGKGTEIGRSFEELRAIIDRVELQDK